MIKRKILVRPRNHSTKKSSNNNIIPLNMDIEYLDTNARQHLLKDIEYISDYEDNNLKEDVVATNIAHTDDCTESSLPIEEKQIDLSGIGTEIVNDESFISEVCYAENCGRPTLE